MNRFYNNLKVGISKKSLLALALLLLLIGGGVTLVNNQQQSLVAASTYSPKKIAANAVITKNSTVSNAVAMPDHSSVAQQTVNNSSDLIAASSHTHSANPVSGLLSQPTPSNPEKLPPILPSPSSLPQPTPEPCSAAGNCYLSCHPCYQPKTPIIACPLNTESSTVQSTCSPSCGPLPGGLEYACLAPENQSRS